MGSIKLHSEACLAGPRSLDGVEDKDKSKFSPYIRDFIDSKWKIKYFQLTLQNPPAYFGGFWRLSCFYSLDDISISYLNIMATS